MKTTNTFGIVFYLKKCKAKEGKAPIYVRITVDGKRCDIAIKQNIDISNWNHGKGMPSGKSDGIKALNIHLEQVRSRLCQCYQELQRKNNLITAEHIKNLFLGREEKEHTLMSIINYHNNELTKLLKPGTCSNYKTMIGYVKLFLKDKLFVSDLYLSQLNYKFLIDFELFLKSYYPKGHTKQIGQNAAMKYIQRFRKLINVAIKFEWLDKDPFSKYKLSYVPTNRVYLSLEELNAIECKKFNILRLEQVKDIFIFSCYTGLAYIDVASIAPQNISLGIDGEYWILTNRKKNDQPVRVPLLPKAMEIIEKYKDNPIALSNDKLFPVVSNQKVNAYLKEIADICGITKTLTFHMARHTFATTVTLTNGVPIETVSSMLGHNSIKTTQIYAKVIQHKVSFDMKALREKMQLSKQQTESTVQSQAV